jgi:hypothetical protein
MQKNLRNQNIYAEFSKLLIDRMPETGVGLYASLKKDTSGNPIEGTYYFSPNCFEIFALNS